MTLESLHSLQTESRNPLSTDLDLKTTRELVALMNHEDINATKAVAKVIPRIAAAVDALYPRLQAGGRLIYMGAGTSGRLGVLDAAEIPPTFSASPKQFVALIAGRRAAMFEAQEGAEDDEDAAITDLKELSLRPTDSVMGIASSGRTPYVLCGLRYAKSLDCLTIGIVCVEPSEIGQSNLCDFLLNPVTGAEVVTGSTRLKAGTATKQVLNMISTVTMIKMGKTYGNLMVDLKPTNLKLLQRSRNIFRMICGSQFYSGLADGNIVSLVDKTPQEVNQLITEHFDRCLQNLKIALVVGITGSSPEEAVSLLASNKGNLKQAIESANAADESSMSDPESGVSSATSSTSIEEDSMHKERFAVHGTLRVPQMVLPTLVIDGGGSKTAAVITLASGIQVRGTSGASSVTTSNVNEMVKSIIQATRNAIKELPENEQFQEQDLCDKFSSVWVALAGVVSGDKSVYDSRYEALRKIFPNVRLTGDTQLLASVLVNYPGSNCLALIAGTGCSCMGYSYDGRDYRFLGKNGGWGPDLGDEGAGYYIGMQLIKRALSQIDAVNIQQNLNKTKKQQKHSLLVNMVVDHFDQTPETLLPYMIEFFKSPNVNERRTKISQLARLALEGMQESSSAPNIDYTEIVEESASLVARTTLPFVSQPGFASNSILVLSGSLLCMKTFGTMVLDRLAEMGVTFKAVEVVNDPASTAGKLSCR